MEQEMVTITQEEYLQLQRESDLFYTLVAKVFGGDKEAFIKLLEFSIMN